MLPRTPRILPAATAALLLLGTVLPATAGFRVMNWNILKYDNLFVERDPSYQTVLAAMPQLDIIAVQEIEDSGSFFRFRNNNINAVDPGTWTSAQFFDDPSSSIQQGVYYNFNTMLLVSADTLGNSPRDIPYYRFRPKPYNSADAEFIIFSTHFKAGSSTSDKDTRELEAERLRAFMNTFPEGTHMIVVGDFNMQSSTEAAFIEMITSGASLIGRLKDPIQLFGSWNNNSSMTYTVQHTQSTRTSAPVPNDTGAIGGMDDRFDFIMCTHNFDDGIGLDYIQSTYAPFGQDGLHFNDAISDAPVIPEGQAVADALEKASDHMPVILQFEVPPIVDANSPLAFGTVIIGATAEQTLTVANTAVVPANALDYTMTAPTGFTAPGGPFQASAGVAGNAHTISMDTSTEGVLADTLVVDSDDMDNPSLDVLVDGTVVRHAVPSLSDLSSVLADSLDFGSEEEGVFADSTVAVSNLNHDSLQALLNVYQADITGGDGRFSVVGFGAVDVGGTAEVFTLSFDDAGSAVEQDTTYKATLTFSTRDEQALPGATDLSDLTVTLCATVKGLGVTAVGDPIQPGTSLLWANHPNPFVGATRIRFALARAGQVDLAVFDVQGRRVATLQAGWLETGEFERPWDGRGDDGRQAAPGVYFYRLRTPDFSATRRMTKLP